MRDFSFDNQVFKIFGGEFSDGFRGISQCTDGGFLLAGYTFSESEGGADILLIKTDSEGNLLWEKKFGGSGCEYANCVKEDSAGNIFLAGFTTSFGNGNEDFYVIKTDSIGNIIWQKNYGSEETDIAEKFIFTENDELIIAGFTEKTADYQDDMFLIKINTEGDTLWTKTKMSLNSQFAKDIIHAEDDEYLVLGSSGSFSAQGWGNRQVITFKIDADGNDSSFKTYGESSLQNWGNAVTKADSDNYIIVGTADITYNDLDQMYALKTKPLMNLQWQKRYGESAYYDYGHSVLKYSEDNYFIIGVTKNISNDNNICVVHIDQDGIFQKKEIYGGYGNDWVSDAVLSKDKRYIVITGFTSSFDSQKI